MPAGASQKREHEFKQLRQRFQHEGRYKGREDEVAARIVNKQRSQYGETKEAKQKDRTGASPDRNLPIDGYEHMTISQVQSRLDELSSQDIRKLRTYEARHKNRKGMMAVFERYLHHA